MSGIQHYITDLNTRFTNQLFATKTGGVYDFNRKFWGLARVDFNNLPYYNNSGEYVDVLFNDQYDLSLFYVINGDEKIIPYATESKLDIIITAKMTSFSGYTEEDIIEKVYKLMVTSIRPESITRDINALKEFNYQEKIKETLHPYFVFRIKCKLVGILKQ